MFAQNLKIDCSKTIKVPEQTKKDTEQFEQPPELFFAALCGECLL